MEFGDKLENLNKNTKETNKHSVNREYGLYDINGIYPNPLTGQPIQNISANGTILINGEQVPRTYQNLAKSWSSKIVYNNKDKIIDTIIENQIILLTAGTGVGKTILVPRIALHALDYKDKVLCTIPKRIPTFDAANFVAECMDVELGEHVGYYYQGAYQVNKNNVESKLIFTTTGSILSRITGSDPLLSDYKCIIIDEAHERSVQTDQLLLLIKKICMKRKDLKVIIMSATIDLNVFRRYFPKTLFKFGEVDAGSELSFGIKEYWADKMPVKWQEMAVTCTMKLLKKTNDGDILIFVKSGGDANQICNLLEREMTNYRKEIRKENESLQRKITKSIKSNGSNGVSSNGVSSDGVSSNNASTENTIPPEYKINPLCVKLEGSSGKDEKTLATSGHLYKTMKDKNGYPYTRKVVVSTNVAESSITVEGIVYIIDSGYEYTDSYEPTSRARALLENTIAQSAVKQRKGRAGRTQPGVCFHLYSEREFQKFDKFPTPGIEKSDITNDILDLMKLEEGNTIKKLRSLLDEFISPPHEKFIINSLKTLFALGAITNITDNGTITPLGIALSRFRTIKATLARSIIASYFYGCSRSVCDIVALATICDGRMDSIILDFHPDKRKTPELNRKEQARYKELMNSFKHPYGDYMTLLKIYKMYLATKMKMQPQKKISKKNPQGQQRGGAFDSSKLTKSKTVPGDEVLLELDLDDKIDSNKGNNKNIKKWCKDNYLSAYKLEKVYRASSQLYDTLQGIIKQVKQFKDIKIKPNGAIITSGKEKSADVEMAKFVSVNNTIDELEMEPVSSEAIKIQRETARELSRHSIIATKSEIVNDLVVLENNAARDIDLDNDSNIDKPEQEGGFTKLKSKKGSNPFDKLESNVKRFPNEDDNIMMALGIGNFVNFAIRDKKKNDIYISCFAQNKKFTKISNSSFLDKPGHIVMYDEIFMMDAAARVLKLNLVNNIPANVFRRIMELYKAHIRFCS